MNTQHMGHIQRHEEIELDAPTLVEGMPGIGLVGKIATDHLIEEFDMSYYASIHCEGIAPIGVYEEGDRTVRPPVRLYVDEERDLLALRSDVPIPADATSEFATCLTGLIESEDVDPLYLSGFPAEKDDEPPGLFGVATGEAAADRLDNHGIDRPDENGAVAGPAGGLLNRAAQTGLDSTVLVVESDPQFPDPEAARILITRGIEPLAGIDVEVEGLVEQADSIREQKEQLAQRMQEADTQESSQAQQIKMFQ